MRKFLSAAMLAAVFMLNLGFSSTVLAVKLKYMVDPDSGDILVIYMEDDGEVKISFLYDKNGKYIDSFYPGKGNPSPDDPSSGEKGDLDSQTRLALQNALVKGLVGEVVDFWGTPLGKALTQRGHGSRLAPIHYPGEAGYEAEGFESGGGGFDPSGGSPHEQFKRKKKGRKGDTDEDDDDADDPGTGDDMFLGMPGPPELVNPPPTPGAGIARSPVLPVPQPEAAQRIMVVPQPAPPRTKAAPPPSAMGVPRM